jgi:hypothetical protein
MAFEFVMISPPPIIELPESENPRLIVHHVAVVTILQEVAKNLSSPSLPM